MQTTSNTQVSKATSLDAEISAEPSHGGVVLTITRRKTRRIWMSPDEIPRVIAALQAHVAPVTVRQLQQPGGES